MRFAYKTKNREGKIQEGIVVAVNQVRAEQLLAENGLTIISLEKKEESFFAKINPFGKTVSNKDLVVFSRQLATLISARVPIIQALRILVEQVTNPYLLSITSDLVKSVENGESLSLAMTKYDRVFGNVYTSLVKAGEASGSLDRSLLYLADQLEKDYQLKSKVKSALTYPVFVVVALIIVAILMFKFVLPKLTSVLEEQGGSLPTISIWLISFTHFFDRFWWLVLMLVAIIIVALKAILATDNGRYEWDKIKIQLPIVGDIFKKIYLARFSRNLSTLIRGGIPIIKAMEIVSEVVNNVVYREILMETATKISAGKSISEGLLQHSEFPPMVTQMIRVGEQTAQLDDILSKVAVFYEQEVDNKISTLTTLLEPAIMIVLGIGVGMLVAGILLPIYNLASTAT